MRVTALYPAQAGVGALRHRSQAFRVRCKSSQACRAEQTSSWLDKGNSNSVRDDYDAVIALAGGLTPQGGLPEWVTRRLDAAAEIYHLQGRACPVLCLGGGTPHKPAVLGSTGHVLHESTVCAEYLLGKGVPAADILKEVSSYDTVGNGYFALTIHAIPAAWRRCSVITSSFHMPRSRAIFQDCFAVAGSTLHASGGYFSLDFHAVHDEGIFPPDVLAARQHREQESLERWRNDTRGMCNLAQLHAWLHRTHLCYSVSRQGEFGKRELADDKVTEKVLASY
ncbi:g743 [Coccomyxa viridis]|uniref:G743 protein n=1 Tax=Coccomyxa viridis TaxID=1274662 RepID=A0ABP1FGG0_9CHLO